MPCPIRMRRTGTFRFRRRTAAYEGIACVDDTARAAVRALARSTNRRVTLGPCDWPEVAHLRRVHAICRRDFANFVRTRVAAKRERPDLRQGRSVLAPPSPWALARAYRVTGKRRYLRSYQACNKPDPEDGKIQAVLGPGEAQLFQADGESYRRELMRRAVFITTCGPEYFRDDCSNPNVHLWGYHELHAVALAGRLLKSSALIEECRKTVNLLVEPVVRDRFDYAVGPSMRDISLPARLELRGTKDGLCAYCISPTVQGLAELYRATGAQRYGPGPHRIGVVLRSE